MIQRIKLCLFSGIIAAAVTFSVRVDAACTVNWTDVRQRIDGFGASCAFSGRNWSDSIADTFFSTTNVGNNVCIGLSLLRNQIKPGGFASASELSLMRKAQARGARLWSVPWTPQSSFKDTNSNVGGSFLSASNNAYAAQLARYVKTNTDAGLNIYAISIQNEPDANVTYDSCHWTPQQIRDFIPFLYTNLVASNVAATKIIIPESQNWISTLYTTALNNTNVAAKVSIIANHNYGGNYPLGETSTPAVLPKYGKALWQSEVMTADPLNASITNALYWARRIHLFLTVPEVNAWHYWWLTDLNNTGDNQALMTVADVPTKRMYVLGQFSRFVRPDYHRIGATNTDHPLITAYKGTNGNFAIVAINTNATPINQTFNLTNFTAGSVTPWITSATLSLAAQAAVTVSNRSFSYALPAMSVTTFVGIASNVPPAFNSISLTNGLVRLTINGNAGTDYTLRSSTNLADWQFVLTTNFLSLPATLTVTNPIEARRYYRLQLGP